MRQRNFVWSPPTVLGSGSGWIPEGAGPGWFPGNGFLVAHDLLEHLSNKSDWEHELRAAGVAAYDVSGVAVRNFESIANDIVNFAARDHHFRVNPAPKLAHKPLEYTDEKRVQALVSEIAKQVKEGMDKVRGPEYEVPQEAKVNAPSFAEKATPWIRLGYRAALRVYGKGQGRATGRLIDALRDAINSDHDSNRPLKGDKLALSVDTRAKTFTLKRVNADTTLTKKQRDSASFVAQFTDLVFGGR